MVAFSRSSHTKMLSLSTLLKSGFTPTLKDLNNFLYYLSRNQRFRTIIFLFTQLSSNRINADAETHTIFAKALLKEHKYEEAADFLKTLLRKSEVLFKNRIFDSLIQGLCCRRDPERGFSLLKGFLKEDGIVPSSRTFTLLIYSFSSMRKMDRVIELLDLMSNEKLGYPFDNYVCSSVISGFVRLGEPELAVGFYEKAVKSGSLKPNTVTCTAVLNAFCKLKNINMISDLVSWMENHELAFDAVFYSSWIYGCFRGGLIQEAFQKYRAMVDRKLEMDTIGYSILIDGFSKDGNVEKAVGFLYKMEKDGVQPNLVTYTSIILGFCRKRKLEEAFAIFRMLKNLKIEVDEFTYAILIHGVCCYGDLDLAFQLLDEMEKRGITTGIVTYNTVINGLCKVGRTSEADDFSKAISGDLFTYSTLLHGYVQERSESGILETRKRLEAAGIHMDVVMCNILIKGLLMVGLFEDAHAIYKGLSQVDVPPNHVTYFTLINGYCKAGRMDEALEIFDEVRKTSHSSAACYKCIILGLCRKGMLSMAIDVFSEYVGKDLPFDRAMFAPLIETIIDEKGAEGFLNVIYGMENLGHHALHIICNEAICYLCTMGLARASFSLLLFMKRKGLGLTSMCYNSILTSLLAEGKKLLAQLILTLFIKTYGTSDLRVHEILVHFLCFSNVKKALAFIPEMNERKGNITIPVTVFETLKDEGRVLDAYELLVGGEKNLPPMNVVDYSIIIDNLVKGRHIDKALEVCSSAMRRGIALNIITYNSVINGLCHQGCLVEAFRLFDSLEKLNVLPSEVTYGTLIDALVKGGLLIDARMLFDRMFLKDLIPNTHIYNSLINGYCKSSQLEEAVKLFQDLELRNLKPDGFTVASLINGYCQKGDMEGALLLFFEFKSKGLLPDFLGFVYLIRGLCAKGRLEESRGILREMLQLESVIDLLGRVKMEVESDTIENLLIFLCEQGRIPEAVTLLDEVVSMLFSAGRKSPYNLYRPNDMESNTDVCPSTDLKTDFQLPSDVDKLENMLRFNGSQDGKARLLQDVDSVYVLLRSLCLKGEMHNANKLTKLIMELGAVT